MVRPVGIFFGNFNMENKCLDTAPDAAMIRPAELCAWLDIGRTTLWRKVKDGNFPKPVKVTDRITAWSMGTVRAWLLTRAQA